MELGGRLSPPVDQLDPFDVHTGVLGRRRGSR